MEYKLAEQLIAAGYKGNLVHNVLRGLIEACDLYFRKLTLHTPNPKHPEGKWHATFNQHLRKGKGGRGHSPEEAVANLWLELNKK